MLMLILLKGVFVIKLINKQHTRIYGLHPRSLIIVYTYSNWHTDLCFQDDNAELAYIALFYYQMCAPLNYQTLIKSVSLKFAVRQTYVLLICNFSIDFVLFDYLWHNCNLLNIISSLFDMVRNN